MGLTVAIEKSYPGFTLETAFDVEDEIFAVLGESGCGKSLTLKCIAGIEKPDRGRIVLNDRVLYDSEAGINLPPQQRRVGYLFQQYALFPNMTVAENIGVAVPKDKREAVVARFIRDFSLDGMESQAPATLSGGQKQQVALARMLAADPELILLDEPLSALDSNLRMELQLQILDVFDRYRKPILFVSHSRDEVYALSHRLGIIHGGHMDCVGAKEEVFANPETQAGARVTGCKNIAGIEVVAAEQAASASAEMPGISEIPAGSEKPDEAEASRTSVVSAAPDPPAVSFWCEDWQLSFKGRAEEMEGIAAIGIRAHEIGVALDREDLAAFPIVVRGRLERSLPMPFETFRFIRVVDDEGRLHGRLTQAAPEKDDHLPDLPAGSDLWLGLDPGDFLKLK